MNELHIKLKHQITGKTKYIKKIKGYPINVGDTLAFNNSTTIDDLWEVISIRCK